MPPQPVPVRSRPRLVAHGRGLRPLCAPQAPPHPRHVAAPRLSAPCSRHSSRQTARLRASRPSPSATRATLCCGACRARRTRASGGRWCPRRCGDTLWVGARCSSCEAPPSATGPRPACPPLPPCLRHDCPPLPAAAQGALRAEAGRGVRRTTCRAADQHDVPKGCDVGSSGFVVCCVVYGRCAHRKMKP